jgi:hypothetical protein
VPTLSATSTSVSSFSFFFSSPPNSRKKSITKVLGFIIVKIVATLLELSKINWVVSTPSDLPFGSIRPTALCCISRISPSHGGVCSSSRQQSMVDCFSLSRSLVVGYFFFASTVVDGYHIFLFSFCFIFMLGWELSMNLLTLRAC